VTRPLASAASPAEAAAFLREADFVWHQRFELAAGVRTPGVNDVEWLLAKAGLPADLRGKSVLDVGTTNGGVAFELERRGAARVVAVDLYPPTTYGFERIAALLQSRTEFVRASVYELGSVLDETFDIVVFWGVLYHLRHPLLALDELRRLVRGELSIETAIADAEVGALSRMPLVRFYRRDELAGDSSSWCAPTAAALLDWCGSAGLDARLLAVWPRNAPARCLARAVPTPGDPEFLHHSYERRLVCRTEERDLG
jgi:tRNA (mo5U34)-methyltransferase